MNPTDAAKELQRVRMSDVNRRLLERLRQPTMMEAMGKQRDERSFSSLLAWIFENPNFDKSWRLGSPTESPVVYLLRLLVMQATEQGNNNGYLMDAKLHKHILLDDIIVCNVSVATEVHTVSSTKGNGSVDIVISCDVRSKMKPANFWKRLRIIIENKVDSKEHDDQCEKYHDYFSKNKGAGIDVYVYLAINKSEQSICDKFIKITYQELLDHVLTIILKQDREALDPSTRKLKDFVDTISSLKTDKTIIAMNEETKELLKKYYEDNEELIMAAIESFGSEEVKTAVASIRSRTNSLYDVSYNGNTVKDVSMAKVALVAITMLRDAGKTPKEIETILNNSGSFWEKVEEGKTPTSGYTDPVLFDNGDVYLVHTQRYKATSKTFDKLMGDLQNAGFDIKKTK